MKFDSMNCRQHIDAENHCALRDKDILIIPYSEDSDVQIYRSSGNRCGVAKPRSMLKKEEQ